MSSVQSFSLGINYDNSATYLSADSSAIHVHYSTSLGGDVALYTEASAMATASLTQAAKNILYPNNSAKPVKLDVKARISRGSAIGIGMEMYCSYIFDNTSVVDFSETSTSYTDHTQNGVNSSPVTQSNKNSTLQIGMYNNRGKGARLLNASLTLYFTRYDFSATAGTGVTSASVSSSTGYDGDSITFSCVIPTGYVFDGWYNGTTLVSSSQSYTHTVNGADLTLTAKAHQNTHNVNGTYNGSTKAILTGVTGDVTVSYNGKTKTLNASATSHTLACANKVMRGNVSVGSASLATAEKIMRSDLVLDYV